MKLAKILLFTSLIAITGLMTAPATVQAQDMKIGFVDPRAVLERMPEMRAVQQRLQNFAERKQTELAQKERELQTEIELYHVKTRKNASAKWIWNSGKCRTRLNRNFSSNGLS